MAEPFPYSSFHLVQPALSLMTRHPDRSFGLGALARTAGQSAFHWQRTFSAVMGESPKQFSLRLRLTRAAVTLLTTRNSVLDIALACGFETHEGFTRAFRRRFGMSPQAYRSRGFSREIDAQAAAAHARATDAAAPCVGLFHLSGHIHPGTAQSTNMNYSIVRKDLASQPVLVVRARIKRSEVAQTIPSVLPFIFEYAQKNGMPLTGHPFTRYLQVGHGLMTIEVGMRITAASDPPIPRADPPADGVAFEDLLPGGPAVTTIHHGLYDQLHRAYEALESWIETEGLERDGAPWELYITDPAEHPDPKDWQTEVCWPIRQPRGM